MYVSLFKCEFYFAKQQQYCVYWFWYHWVSLHHIHTALYASMQLQQASEIAQVTELEQWLMEGAFNKVWNGRWVWDWVGWPAWCSHIFFSIKAPFSINAMLLLMQVLDARQRAASEYYAYFLEQLSSTVRSGTQCYVCNKSCSSCSVIQSVITSIVSTWDAR